MDFKQYHELTEAIIKQIALAQIAGDHTLVRILNHKLEVISGIFLEGRK